MAAVARSAICGSATQAPVVDTRGEGHTDGASGTGQGMQDIVGDGTGSVLSEVATISEPVVPRAAPGPDAAV